MTGFIRGLFGGNKSGQPEQPKGAFFLDDDSAKSMGDVEYMRSIKATRRTFPVTFDQPDHIEIIQSVSAVDKSVNDSRKAGGYVAPKAVSQAKSWEAPAPAKSWDSSSSASSGWGSPAPASPQASSFSAAAAAQNSSWGSPAEPTAAEPTAESDVRRKSDSSGGMDMFRNMAKDIRK